eukprot:g1710.t1
MYGQQQQQPPPPQQHVDHILNSLSCYADKARIRADVFALQSRVPNCLQPKQGELVHNTGDVSTLLYLKGTVPMYYSGVKYHIPVEIWITELYPNGAPRCYTLIKHLTKKLQVDLEKFYPKTRDKLDEHLEIQMKMDQGRETLKAGMASLERQKVHLAASLKAIEQREREVDEWMQANQSTTEAVPVDEVIQAANTYSDQMYRLSAESSAIEDTLYHLEKALQKETIELDVFLKVSQLPLCLIANHTP